jgi:hypothetical protein
MNMDLLLLVIRATLIIVGIIAVIIIWKGKKEGRFQERYYFGFLIIGITALILGIILLIVSFTKDLSFEIGLYLTTAGAIGLIIGLVIRNRWKKNH